MLSLFKAMTSSVGKKFIMSITGFALVLFVIVHLIGNMLLLKPDGGAAFNLYSDTLMSTGWLVIIIEIGLAAIFLVHIITALMVTATNWSARPEGYAYRAGTKGGPSKKTLSSTTMIYTGVVLAIFAIVHVWQFRFGPGIAEGYVTQVRGREARDIYRLVLETLHNTGYMVFYVASVTFLGFHFRHGFWSAFQSAAVAYARLSKPIYTLGLVIALILTAGFIFLPLWIYFDLSKVLL